MGVGFVALGLGLAIKVFSVPSTTSSQIAMHACAWQLSQFCDAIDGQNSSLRCGIGVAALQQIAFHNCRFAHILAASAQSSSAAYQ